MRILTSLFLALLMSLFTTTSLAQNGGELRTIDAEDVFVPVGYDDNDQISIVLDGWLPDGCFQVDQPEVEVDHLNQTIRIIPKAKYYSMIPCIESLVPFSTVVELGSLSYGDYKVVVNKSENVTEKFQVEEATSSGPDDFLYAPIDNAAVENDIGAQEEVAILYGRFTDSCMVFKDIKVINSGKTLQVLPLIEVEDRPVCQDGIFPFKRSVILPEGMKKGRHLLHVRSLNGKSVNVMFSVFPPIPN